MAVITFISFMAGKQYIFEKREGNDIILLILKSYDCIINVYLNQMKTTYITEIIAVGKYPVTVRILFCF